MNSNLAEQPMYLSSEHLEEGQEQEGLQGLHWDIENVWTVYNTRDPMKNGGKGHSHEMSKTMDLTVIKNRAQAWAARIC